MASKRKATTLQNVQIAEAAARYRKVTGNMAIVGAGIAKVSEILESLRGTQNSLERERMAARAALLEACGEPPCKYSAKKVDQSSLNSPPNVGTPGVLHV